MTIRVLPDGSYEFDRAAFGQSEAGRMLDNCTRQHVAKMIATGELRAVRLGRRVLIPASEIARFLRGDKAGAA